MVFRRFHVSLFFAALTAAPLGLRGGVEEVGRPPMRFFGATELRSKGPVRAFAETPDGSLLVGSNHLVVFDGVRAERIDVSGAYAFRALARAAAPGGAVAGAKAPAPAAGSRVWIGASGAFGYVEPDAFGRWNFVSLAPQARAAGVEIPTQIDAVFALGAGAVFVTGQRVMRWDGRRFESWTLPAAWALKAAGDEVGTVWIEQAGVGLLRLGTAGSPVLARPEALLPAGPVAWILDPAGAETATATAARASGPQSRGEGLLVGTETAVFRLTAEGAERLPSLSALVQGQDPVGAVALESGGVAIMTSGHGVLIGTVRGDATAALNRAHGLGDDSPYAVWGDRRGAVWIGLDDGCTRVDSAGSVSIFDGREGLEAGLPRRVLTVDGVTTVVTDRALYRMESSVDGVARLHAVVSDPRERENLGRPAEPGPRGEDDPPRPTPHSQLVRVGARTFAFAETQILAAEAGRGFAPVPELAGWVGVVAAGRPGSATGYWISQCLGTLGEGAPYALLRITVADGGRGALRWEPLRVGGIDFIDEVTSLDLTDGADGPVIWIGGKGGLLRARLDQLRVSSNPRPLQLRTVQTAGEGAPWLELAPRGPPLLRPGFRGISFGFSAAQPMEVTPLAVYYQTRLAPIEPDWSPPGHLHERDFTGLAPGRYTFLARRVDRYGRAGEPVSYPFAVAAPWYARWPALVGGGLVLATAGWGLLRWRLRRLRAQRDRLDRLVAHRTRELELSNTAKSEFLENISHEIRNPLNGIVGLVNLLQPARLAPAEREVAQSLKASADHLRRVSEEVLDFSQLESGYVTVEHRPFALASTLGQVVELHAGTARAKGTTISLQVPADDGHEFLGDAAKLRTIVGNFLGNALKYAPGSPVEVRADWTEDADGTVQLFVAVTDRGPGLPVEEQELVFQKFVRGSGAKAAGATGSGFGLAICRTLARRMGGNVGVESPVGAGSGGRPRAGASFHVWLPLRRVPAGPAGDRREPAEAPAGAPVELALVVDDEAYNRTVLAGIARELGYEPMAAPTAAAALEGAGRPGVAVVFLDLDLPDGRGDEVARRLRARPGGGGLVIIATTGHDSAAARERCAAAGMDGFLLKPFDLDAVRRALAEVTGQRDQEARRRAFELYARGGAAGASDPAAAFLRAIAAEVAALRAGAAGDDRAAIHGAAHRLRSLAALVRARDLQRAAVQLEQQSAAMSPGERAPWIDEAIAGAERLRAELSARTAPAPGRETAPADHG
jgi:signal transduction histidine kinase/CheY-like chemotaxis protein/HPt (histidine-containing phosphotransfer) domain-containing protein